MLALSARQSRPAESISVSNTACRLSAELLITLSTSAVAACRARASASSRPSRASSRRSRATSDVLGLARAARLRCGAAVAAFFFLRRLLMSFGRFHLGDRRRCGEPADALDQVVRPERLLD